jgi:opacity protein-like surface antigen
MDQYFKTLISAAYILISLVSFGQDSIPKLNEPQKKYAKYINFRVENGAILSNHTEIGDQLINSSYYNGLDIRLGFRKTDSHDVYGDIYRRPFMGIGWYASTFHNMEIGKPHALFYFLTIPLKFERDKKLSFAYTGAFGLSYQFNPFDSIQNPTNIFIGSYRNCYVHLGFEADYKLSENWQLNASLGFKHFSNGSFKQPNYGINLVPLTVGVRYKFTDDPIDLYPEPIPKFKKYNLLNLMLAFGSKNYVNNDPNYLKMTMGVNYLRAINYKYRIGVGVDMFYSAASDLRIDGGNANFGDAFSIAIVPNWEWVVSERIYIPLGVGIYLHHNKHNDERYGFYERAGIRYKLTDHLAAGVTIKAHKGVADYFEWTVGYTFHKDPNKY